MTTPLELKFNPLTENGFNLVPRDLSAITKEKTGFRDPGLVTISYDETTQKITLGGTVEAYYQNAINSTLINGYVSTAHDNVTGSYYWLYADGTEPSNIKWMTDAFPGMDKILIGLVIYYAGYKFCIRECHGMVMDWATHFETHFTIGTWRAGGTITAGTYVSGPTSGTTILATNKRPDVDEITLWDEDLKTILPTLTSKLYNKAFLTGTTASPVINFTGETAEIVPMNTGITLPAYNLLTGGNWTQAAMSAANYQALFVIAIPVSSTASSQAYRYIFVQGQQQSNSLATIQAVTPNNLVLAQLSSIVAEYVIFAKIIINYTGGGTNNWNILSVETLTGNKQGQSFSTSTGLSSVASDTTLTGNGTAASPLGVIGAIDSTFNIDDETDNTKELNFSVGGNTTGVKTTIATAQTTAKTYTLQDVASSNFVMSEGNQTVNGVKTLGSAPIVTDVANGIQLNGGTTAQRSGSPAEGSFRYNTNLVTHERFVNNLWAASTFVNSVTLAAGEYTLFAASSVAGILSYIAQIYIQDGTTYAQAVVYAINKGGTWEYSVTSVGSILPGTFNVVAGTGVLTYNAVGTGEARIKCEYINF